MNTTAPYYVVVRCIGSVSCQDLSSHDTRDEAEAERDSLAASECDPVNAYVVAKRR